MEELVETSCKIYISGQGKGYNHLLWVLFDAAVLRTVPDVLKEEKEEEENGEMQVCVILGALAKKSKVTRFVVGHGSEFISWRTSRHDGEMLVIATSNL